MKYMFLILFIFNNINSINLPWLIKELSTRGHDNFIFNCHPPSLYSHCDFKVFEGETKVEFSYEFKGALYSQELTINKINDNLYLLNEINSSHHSDKFHVGFLVSSMRDKASIFFKNKELNSSGFYLGIKPKFKLTSSEADIDIDELFDNNCIENSVSVKEALKNNTVDISVQPINSALNDDLRSLFQYLNSNRKLVSICAPSLNGCYENTLFLFSEILTNSHVYPSIIKIYCPDKDKYCIENQYNTHYALIIRHEYNRKDYIIDTIFGFGLISLQSWINHLNSQHNASLCLFNLSPQTLKTFTEV